MDLLLPALSFGAFTGSMKFVGFQLKSWALLCVVMGVLFLPTNGENEVGVN